MFIGGIFLLVFVIAIGSFVLWITALVDALRVDDRVWQAAGQSKILWVLLIVFLHLIGAILYFAIAKPALRRVTSPVR